ncbi:MAG: tetratricopeptide repeat protein [Vampirovibrionales bacterium]|nr:tetratricopeptide repeat protein [Vampirovibrionales bacterium]
MTFFVFDSAPRRMLAATLPVAMLSGLMLLAVTPSADAQVRLRGYIAQSTRKATRLFETGRWEEAEKIYARDVRSNPNSSNNRAYLGIVQAELFKLGAAEESARKALAKDPKNPYAHIALGVVYRNQTASSDMTYRAQREELLNKAANEFKTALRYDANNPDAYNRLGEVYRTQGRLEEASDAFEKAAQLDRNFSEAVANRGTILKAQGRPEEAIREYRRAIQLNSKNYKAHYYLGEALADQGRYHDAYQALNTSLSQNRNSEMVYAKMGDVLLKQGNESAAIAKYREAIRVKPEYVGAYQKLAQLFDTRGDGELAVSELRSALNANPNLDALKLDAARLSLAVDKPDQALRYYQDVLAKDPANPDALQGLAQTYLVTAQDSAGQGMLGGSDKYVDAEEAIGKALQANPNDLSLHLAMLQVSRLSGKPELAQQELEAMTRIAPRNDSERIAQGEALFALGRYQESDPLFRELLTRNQNNPAQQLKIADALKINGDLDTAAEAYKMVLTRNPQNLKAQRGLHRLDQQRAAADKNLNLAQSFKSVFSKAKKRTAKDYYLESVSLYPRQPEVRLALAKIYQNEDDYGKAILEYQAYVNLRPDMEAGERERYLSKISHLQQKLAERQGRSMTPTAARYGAVSPAAASSSMPPYSGAGVTQTMPPLRQQGAASSTSYQAAPYSGR